MKKVVVVVCVLALALGSMSMTADAAKGGNSANQICTAFLDQFFDSHGECVSALRTGIVNFCRTDFAKQIFGSTGQCVSAFRP